MLNLLPVKFGAHSPVLPVSAPQAHPLRGGRVEARDCFIPRFAAKIVAPERPLVDPGRVKIFSGRANPNLSREIAAALGISLSPLTIYNQKSSETYVRLDESVQGCDVFLVQPTHAPVNDNLMELLVMIDAARQDDAKSITAVIPYYGYARQDRRTDGLRESISSKLVAKLVKAAGADRVVVMDLHNQIQEGFFDIPVTHLTARDVLARYIGENDLSDAVIVSPDAGGLVRARGFAEKLNLPYVVVEKRRSNGEAKALNIIGGDIEGKVAIILDDMIDTAGTISESARLLMEAGARKVIAVASHGVFSNPAPKNLKDSVFAEVVVTNSIPLRRSVKQTGRVTQLSVAPQIADAIQRICKRPN